MLYGYGSITIIGMMSINPNKIKLKKGAWLSGYFTTSTDMIDNDEFVGNEIEISCCSYNRGIAHALPLNGKIETRVEIQGSKHSNAWIVQLNTAHTFNCEVKHKIIVELNSQKSIIRTDKKIMAKLFAFTNSSQLKKNYFLRKDLKLFGWTMIQQEETKPEKNQVIPEIDQNGL